MMLLRNSNPADSTLMLLSQTLNGAVSSGKDLCLKNAVVIKTHVSASSAFTLS